MMPDYQVGSIVRCRKREWVVIPSQKKELMLLRPLSGSEQEITGIHKKLAEIGIDPIEPASFPLPSSEDISDYISTRLLFNAARLSLRDGAGPFRSLARVAVRPRPYQYVPMLMALRINPIRMLIADDVGIGKTIEALLIARELLDRGEIQRFCVLCPPYLCSQWETELKEKFNISPVVIRSGTVNQLQNKLPTPDISIFKYFPFIIVSIDFAKSERHQANFILNCPELVIVDEVHGAAQTSGSSRVRQQRHQLLKKISSDPERHLLMLTATPHSGLETSFLSLLGLIKPDFLHLNLQSLSESERVRLAHHFIQRRRPDVTQWLGERTPFPKRDPIEVTYELSPKYQELFQRVFDFSRELVRTGETLKGWKRRIRFWTALSLLRCVMSSPASASAALLKRASYPLEEVLSGELSDENYAPYIYEPTDRESMDTQPSHIIQEGERELKDSEQRKLRSFAKIAQAIIHSDQDEKIKKCSDVVSELLDQNFHPIVWCRYIATSDYVAAELRRRLNGKFHDFRAISITGSIPEDERKERIKEIEKYKKRVLVATDCLSEGINLQEKFNAVVHYDLPWNPNRLEQREGRVDRFGQKRDIVKTVLLYGKDNPVDGAVLNVLIRKAREIYKLLGTFVPIPRESETVMEAIVNAIFLRRREPQQMALFEDPAVNEMHQEWVKVGYREKESRTRFAQRAIKPEEVQREIDETDQVLGDPQAVRNFVLDACQRLDVTYYMHHKEYVILTGLDNFPPIVRNVIPDGNSWKISFNSPSPEGVTYIGRNHPFVNSLAQHLLEAALQRTEDLMVGRCAVVRSSIVDRQTNILLLRLRFTIEEPEKRPILSEEVYVCGYKGSPLTSITWLNDEESLDLFSNLSSEISVSQDERKEIIDETLKDWEGLQQDIAMLIRNRANRLEEAHKRVRKTVKLKSRGLKISPHLPPDLIGLLVISPIAKGVERR